MVEPRGRHGDSRGESAIAGSDAEDPDAALSASQLPGWSVNRLDYPTFRVGLIAKVMDRLTIRQLLEQDGLTYAEWRVLARIGAMKDGGTAGQVAEMAWVDGAEVSRAISALERRGFLERRTNPSDRRTSILFLTDAGKARYSETLERRGRFHEQLLSSLSQEERQTLDELLGRIGQELLGILKNGLPE
jgi:DNA-binding MarR family transcriptional regulator